MCNCSKYRNKIDEELFLEFVDAIRNNIPKEEIDIIIEKIRNAKPKTIQLEISNKQIAEAIRILKETKFIDMDFKYCVDILRDILKEIINVKEEDL